jgi:hypothetical protein
MSTVTQKFVLVGAHKGKTVAVNGHEFVDGEYVFQGSHESMATLTRIFAYYDAIPEEQAIAAAKDEELAKLRAQVAAGQKAQAMPVTAAAAEAIVEAAKPATAGAPAAADASGKLPLAEAIGLLSPDADEHWTSNNLPSLQYLSDVTGKAVSRTDVDAIAEGYTRAKARTAKAAQ